jgi:hypothetical protein
MDFQTLSDIDLDAMRRAPKMIANPAARWMPKGGHKEKNFLLRHSTSPTETYRVFVRVSSSNVGVFSVGLARTFSADEVLVLVRYNGAYHSHRNVLEGTKVPAAYHRHMTTQRYIRARLDPSGYAEPISDYNSADGAFDCLCRDCNIAPVYSNSLHATLDF